MIKIRDGSEKFTNAVRRTTRSDWLAWEPAREPLERTIFAFR